jgi:hypothetical protein
MRAKKAVSVFVVLMLVGAVAGAQDTKPAAPVTWATTMPAIELSNQPLEKVLNQMKAKLPGFDFSISREDVPHEYPVLPDMRVENVSLRAFAELIQQQVPGVTVSLPMQTNDFGFDGFEVRIQPNPNQPVQAVRVFELGEIIAHRAAALKGDVKIEDREHIATNDILSLIQAALDVAGDSKSAEMKIHAPTQTLIFKGTDAQEKIVQNVMQVLGNAETYHFDEEMNAKRAEIARLNEEFRIRGNELNELKASTRPVTSPLPSK